MDSIRYMEMSELILLAMVEYSPEPEESGILLTRSHSYQDYPLTPSHRYQTKLIKDLLDSDLITIEQTKQRTELQDIPFPTQFRLTLEKDQTYAEKIGKLRQLYSSKLTKKNYKTLKALAYEIVIEECVFFLRCCVKGTLLKSYDPDGEENSEEVPRALKKALDKMPAFAVFHQIEWGCKNQLAYAGRDEVSVEFATNKLLKSITWRLNNLEVRKFRPRKDVYGLQQSELSRVFFNKIIGIEDGGFNELLSSILGQALAEKIASDRENEK